ncbi:OmpA family protein [Bernardetia sp.]|uniref:OmpA family protein n=1 Tax=Bernardetia sp. TaxID=1937974 RepID=UPI0025B7D47F|nr:OmpA family protein [Bernardetia sp.]
MQSKLYFLIIFIADFFAFLRKVSFTFFFRTLSIFGVVLFFHSTIFAQSNNEVLWANKVIDFSSEYFDEANPTQYTAKQILGKPNVLPAIWQSPCAWSPARPEARQDEWIKVGFEKAISVKQVAIAESFGAGAISAIILYDLEGKGHLIYKNQRTEPVSTQGRMLNVFLKEKTKYKVNAVKIKLNTIDVGGWNNIDAIGISSSETPIKAEINIAKDIPFNKVERLPQTVNSPYNEILPIISPDGKTLFFDRKDHPKNMPSISAGKENDDIWVSRHVSDTIWTEAERLNEPVNNSQHNYVCSVTPDGNVILLANAYLPSGKMEQGISISYKTIDGSWSFPEPLKIKDFYNTDKYAEFCLAPNRKVLIMSVRREDTYGSRDLYISFLQRDNSWSVPKNMGTTLNSAALEVSPTLSSDNKTLYFASNGRSGYGSMDMYVSRRLDDTWTNWSEPMNLGNVLNSAGWDAGYSIDASGEYAYFSSSKHSDTNTASKLDIYRAKLHVEVRPDPVLLISGTVYNSKTKEPIGAEILYEMLPVGEETGTAQADPQTGNYKIALPPNSQYGFLAKSRGFVSVSENIDARGNEVYKEIKRNLYLTPIEVGQKIRLNNVFFKRGTNELLKESFPELDRLVIFMLENPTVTIEVEGHTDLEGIPTMNMKLSALRVKAIQDYLVRQKIDKKRVETRPYGSTQPITRQRDEASKKLNRRVEFKILSY